MTTKKSTVYTMEKESRFAIFSQSRASPMVAMNIPMPMEILTENELPPLCCTNMRVMPLT